MSILRPASIFLRNFLIKQHPYFSCCASCGEITTPLNGRLCTSLAPDFPVDLVLLGGAEKSDDEFQLILKKIKTSAPWVKQIFRVTEEGVNCMSSISAGVKTISAAELRKDMTRQSICCEASCLPLEALLHELPLLDEHFAVARPERDFSMPSHALDLFTPNGIPIIFLRQTEDVEDLRQVDPALTVAMQKYQLPLGTQLQPLPDIYAHTKKNSERFFPVFAELCTRQKDTAPAASADSSDYYRHMGHWVYAQGLAIPQMK